MSCIHYKFRSSLDYDTITFDGLSISLADLKREIMAKKKVGKNTDFGLEVTNAQTKEVYKDEATIPRNSSVVLRRIPMGTRSKAQLAADRADPCASGVLKTSDIQDFQQVPATSKTLNKIADLANANASEEDKLKAMMSQAGEDWDPSQYQKGRRPYGGTLPASYVCYRCGKNGHFIRNCPTNGDERFDLPKVKRTTGIPRTFFESGASSPSQEQKNDTPEKVLPAVSSRKKVPGELQCPMCKNLLSDAVLIPCCGTSYCDDCIRNCLLENELQCPYCGTENVSPDSLVINKQLRLAVSTFRNARPGSPFTTTSLKGSASPVPDLANKPVADAKVDNVSDAEKVTPNNKTNAVKAPDTKEPEKKPAEKASEVPKSEGDKSKQALPAVTHPQSIKVRQPVVQAGPPHVGPKFEPHRRPEDFHPRDYHGPRGPPHLGDAPHNLRDPAMPRRIPPEQIPHVPALRPAHSIPHMVHPMTGYVPPASMPVHPPAVMLPIRLPHPVQHPFAPPMFDPLLPQGELPPMSEEEFYRLQKKLKHKTETRHKRKREVRGRSRSHSQERPEKSSRGRPERSRRDYAERARIQNSDRLKREVPGKSKQSGRTKRKGGGSDFADELFAYKELQRSRQEHSRSRSVSRSPSRSRSRPRSHPWSRPRSRPHSGSWSGSSSNSSPGLTRSPTPEDWDKSRSPSPATPDSTKVPGEKKHKHKKRKKHQKDKSSKKQKTGHEDQTDGKKVLPSGTEGDAQTVEKTAKKKHKKHKEKDKVKGKAKEANRESDKKEKKISTGKEKEKEKEDSKTKEKKIEKGSSKGKEKEIVKGQESSKDNGVEILPEGKESVKFKESSKSQDVSEVKESKSKDGTVEAKTKDKSKSKDKHRRKSKDSESGKKHKSKKKHKKKHKHQKKKKSKSTASASEENGTTTLTETEKGEKESGHEAGTDGGIDEQDPAEQESVSDQDESDEEDTVEKKDASPEESASKVTGEASSDAEGKANENDEADERVGEQGEGNSPSGDAELDQDADTKEGSDTKE